MMTISRMPMVRSLPRLGRRWWSRSVRGQATTLAGWAMTTNSWSYGQANPLISVELAAARTESKCAAASA